MIEKVFFFGIGLIFGSFLNSIAFRLEKKENFLLGRSYCPHCQHSLSWKDLIPVISFIFLGGKCRYCQKPISWQYPLVELASGFLFFLAFEIAGFFQNQNMCSLNQGLFQATIFSFLILIFIFDIKKYAIPEEVLYPFLFFILFWRIFEVLNFGSFNFFLFKNLLFSAFFSFPFFLLIFFSKEKLMGWGDFYLIFALSLYLSFPKIVFALLFAIFSGAIIGSFLILTGKKNLKSPLPFAPFLIFGTFFSIFFEKKLIAIFSSFF